MKLLQFRLRSLFVLTLVAACALYFRPLPETELKRKLKTPVTAKWANKPLDQALQELAREHGIRIHLDPRGLNQEGLRSDTPVSIDLQQQVMLRNLLAILFEDLNLTYEIRTDPLQGQYFYVTSEQLRESETVLFRQTFDVADLARTAGDLERLASLIEETSAPQRWESVGGRGKITRSEATRTLEVTQTPGVMELVGDLLNQLKRIESKGRAHLAQLAQLDSGSRDSVAWTVYLGRNTAVGTAEAKQQAALPAEWASRVDAIVQDHTRLRLWDAWGDDPVGQPPVYYKLVGEVGKKRYSIWLRSSGTLNISKSDDEDHSVQVGLRADALDDLRHICQQALSEADALTADVPIAGP